MGATSGGSAGSNGSGGGQTGSGIGIKGVGVSKHRYGSDYFVRGENFDSFESDYYSPDGSTFEAYDVHKEITISPGLIEGIHLGEGEVNNPSVFWSQHEQGGTKESFVDIARHIPDVQEQLEAGRSIEDLKEDPVLSDCTWIYFVNKPRVVEHDGYYEFDSNGRHRILAAREAGYDIPVVVIGRRHQKGTENAVNATLSPSGIISNAFIPPRMNVPDVKEPDVDVAPLLETRQTKTIVKNSDGSEATVLIIPMI